MGEQKRTVKAESIKKRVEEGINERVFLKPREATRTSKEAFKQAKKDYKLKRKIHKGNRGVYPKSIQFRTSKEALKEAKINKKVNKRIYKKTKKKDPTRIAPQIKRESKLQVKHDVKMKINQQLQEDDNLSEAAKLMQQAHQSKYRFRQGLKVSKEAGKLSIKTGKGLYGISNRTYNLVRGNGFQRTPPSETARAKLVQKLRLRKQRIKIAMELKKERSVQAVAEAVIKGKKSMVQGIKLIAANPITWIVVFIFILLFVLSATVVGTPRPAIVQDDFDLNDSWTYVTKLDADHTDETNQFYSNIDDIMFYMNRQFDDYRLKELRTPTETYEKYLSNLWDQLNGKSPNYELKTIKELTHTKNSLYFMEDSEYEEMEELRKEFGYSTLEDSLSFPFKTDSLTVSRRYGYEKKEGKIILYPRMEVEITQGTDVLSPMSGKIRSVPTGTSVEIENQEGSRLLIKGVKSTRFIGGETVEEGVFLGKAETGRLELEYKRYSTEKKEWLSVNPAFYFPKVVYSQQTTLGSEYDYQGLSKEVIALIPKFKEAMKAVGMPEKFLPIVLAVCMQESGGRAVDVMQCSESLGLPPNTLGTEASIKQGVKYLWGNMNAVGLSLVEKDEKYLKTAVQAYNYGGGFIVFARQNGLVYTPELALAFAMKMSGGSGGYGDPQYVPHVWRYISVSARPSGGKFAYPLPNRISDVSGFDYRENPITGQMELHKGLDLPVPTGTHVFASEDAVVMRSADVGDGYGINVVLKHSKGGYWTRYAHLSGVAVHEGDTVKRGQLIGYVGSTGMSTGPHLHYEVMTSIYAGHVDPRPFIQ